MAQLAREVRMLRARCERLSLHGAEARILHALESEGTEGTLTLAQSRKAWAADLGLTHEALTARWLGCKRRVRSASMARA
ncbi:MAG: hypothetical protein M5R42_03950 [Rhodocyclaceae bacterium]|nr:hypothetical protein [Rhodocyclaceae bacterium]